MKTKTLKKNKLSQKVLCSVLVMGSFLFSNNLFAEEITGGLDLTGKEDHRTDLIVSAVDDNSGDYSGNKYGVLLDNNANIIFDGNTTNIKLDLSNDVQSSSVFVFKGSDVEFSANETNIVNNSVGGSGKWTYGLYVNYKENGSVDFNGEKVNISTYSKDYSTAALRLDANSKVEFNNTDDVNISAKSPYGITTVQTRGEVVFNNQGNVIINADTDNKVAVGGVVGVNVSYNDNNNGTLNVTNNVKNFNINIIGAGIDDDSTGYSNGTVGLRLNTEGTTNINSENFSISIDVQDSVDTTNIPGNKTAEEVHGITNFGATLNVGENTNTNIIINEELGSGYGVYSKAETNILGNTSINVSAKDDAYALMAIGQEGLINLGSEGKIIELIGDVAADNSGTVNLSGNATESSTGVYSVSNNGTVNFNTGNWTVNEWKGTNGNINVSENTTVNINNTITVNNAEISDGSILAINTDKVKDVVINAVTASLGTEAEIKIINSDIGNTGVKLFDDKHSDLNKQAEQQMTSNNLMQTVGIDGDGNIVIGVADASEVLPNVVIGGIITGLTANNIHYDFFDDVLKSGDADKATVALNSVANMGELAGVNHGTYSMSNAMTDAVANHLSLATHGEQDKDIWAHYIHNKEDIDGMDFGGVDGSYEAQYNGIVVGSDLYKNGKTTAGIALSYADGNINGSNIASSTKNDAEYYGASLYGRIDNGDSAILGDISYMHSDNDITQNNSGHEITASADADAFSIGIRAEQAYKAGAGKFVPYAGIRYMHLGAGNYDNSLGMSYDADDQNLWLLPVGVTYSAEVQSGDWTVKPIAEVGYVWTMGDRDTDQTVSLNGAADTFGFETADSGSFIGRLGIEAEKADVTYGLSYEYQKGDTVKANKWMANLTFSF